MISQLIKEVFHEAEIRTGKTGNKRALSENIHNWMFNNLDDGQGSRISISVKTFERIYDKYILDKEEARQRSDPGGDQLNYFSQYLGFNDYTDYIQRKSNHEQSQTDKNDEVKEGIVITNAIVTDKVESKTIKAENYTEQDHSSTVNNVTHNYGSKKSKYILLISIFTAIVVTIILWINSSGQEELCLVWKQNHYESVDCNQISSSDVTITIDQKEWEANYRNFKRIDIDENTPLISSKGKTLVWYQQKEDEFEFYNAGGQHPITGKMLTPITFNVAKEYFRGQNKDAENKDLLNSSDDTSRIQPQEDDKKEEAAVEIDKPVDQPIDESVEVKGKYCFKNTMSDKIQLVLTLNSSSFSSTTSINPNEQICLFLPVGQYHYASTTPVNRISIQDGAINISENREGYLSLSKELKEKPPVEDKKECLTGDYKIINNSGEKLEIRLSDYGVNGPLATFFKTIHVQVGKSGSFFGIKGGVYVLEITKSNNHLKTEKMNIRIENCKTIEYAID
jgi:hypothetical protein